MRGFVAELCDYFSLALGSRCLGYSSHAKFVDLSLPFPNIEIGSSFLKRIRVPLKWHHHDTFDVALRWFGLQWIEKNVVVIAQDHSN